MALTSQGTGTGDVFKGHAWPPSALRHGEVSGGEIGTCQGKDGLVITISFEAIDVAFAANIASVYHGVHSNRKALHAETKSVHFVFSAFS